MALHKLLKKRARKSSVFQADSKVRFHTITNSISLVTNYQYHELRNKLANQKSRYKSLRLCGFEHGIVCWFADALYTRFSESAAQAICCLPLEGQKKVTAHDIPLDENTRIVL